MPDLICTTPGFTTRRRAYALAFALAYALTLSTGAATRTPHARAAYAQDASAKPSQEPGVSEESDAARAEEACARGEALSKQGDTRGALEALSEAVKLYKSIYLGHRTPTPLYPPDSTARFRSQMSAQLRRAPQCIELYRRLDGVSNATDFERSQLEALRGHALGMGETDASRAVFFGPETDTRAVITYKPEPRYPRNERGRKVHVTVRLRVILGADGEVRDAFVLMGPPSISFSESSVEAAKGLRFTPAVKGGRTVSQFVTLEYNFQTF
jgi:TonB family protein